MKTVFIVIGIFVLEFLLVLIFAWIALRDAENEIEEENERLKK